MSNDNAIVECYHCAQWGAVYTQCRYCGAPIQPDPPSEDNSPLIACNHCNQFGINRKECQYCGAPMPEKLIYVDEDVLMPYWMDGGTSLRSDDKLYYATWV